MEVSVVLTWRHEEHSDDDEGEDDEDDQDCDDDSFPVPLFRIRSDQLLQRQTTYVKQQFITRLQKIAEEFRRA